MDISMNIEEIAEVPYDGKGVIEVINATKSQVKLLKSSQKIIIIISDPQQPLIKAVVVEKESKDIKNEKTELENIIIETKSPIEKLAEDIKNINNDDLVINNLPTEQQVIDYITSKPPDFEYHTVELQERFLGKRVKYRENPTLYGSFDRIINNAALRIAKTHGREWEHFKTLSLGGKTHVYVYRLKKSEETEVKAPEVRIPITLNNYKPKESTDISVVQ
ncbi:MAG: hypothetical protein WAW23_13190 [Candidatus Methanoperedens sp.]